MQLALDKKTSDSKSLSDAPGLPLKTKKRSTTGGDARTKLIAALTTHHGYDNGSCDNVEPIGNNALARLAEVANSTASAFLKKQFGGRSEYSRACADSCVLRSALKLLNQEYAPFHILGHEPTSERDSENDDKI